jgi:hypothetical protein
LKDENGDLLADSHNNLNGWKNYFSQLLNVHMVSDGREMEIHTAGLLVPMYMILGLLKLKLLLRSWKGINRPVMVKLPITVAKRSKAWTVFDRADSGTVGSNHTQGMDV